MGSRLLLTVSARHRSHHAYTRISKSNHRSTRYFSAGFQTKGIHMNPNNDYLKPHDPLRQSIYPDEMIRADGTVRNPDYQSQSNAGWIWAGVVIAAFAIIAFTFFGNDTRQEIPPSSITSTTPVTSPTVTSPATTPSPTDTGAPAAVTTPSPTAPANATAVEQLPGATDPSATATPIRTPPVNPDAATPQSNR
jgi:hypothetical protein